MPVTLTLRATKGSALTNTEMDTNLANIKSAVEAAEAAILALPTTEVVDDAINLVGTGSISTTTTATTKAFGTNDTTVATTAFVQEAVNPKAPLDSPALTGTPTTPTATVGAPIATPGQIASLQYADSQAVFRIEQVVKPATPGTTFIVGSAYVTPTAPINGEILGPGVGTAPYTFNGSYTELVNFYVNVRGTYRVSFIMTQPSGSTAFGRVYKNGVAVGIERIFGDGNGSPDGVPTYTEDFTLAAGDTVQIFAAISNPVDWVEISNVLFRISFPPMVSYVTQIPTGVRSY